MFEIVQTILGWLTLVLVGGALLIFAIASVAGIVGSFLHLSPPRDEGFEATIRRIDAKIAREKYGTFVPWIPRIQWLAAIATFTAFLATTDWEWVLGHWSNVAALLGGSAFLAAVVHGLTGGVLQILAEKGHTHAERWADMRNFFYITLHLTGVIGTFIHQMFFNGFVYEGWNWFFQTGYSFLISQIWPLYWGWKGMLWLAQ